MNTNTKKKPARFVSPAEFSKKLESDPIIMAVFRRLADR
jgi:hypothetical protein